MRVLICNYRDDFRAGGSLRVGQGLGVGLRRLGIDARICFAYGGRGPVGRQDPSALYLGLRDSGDWFHWYRARKILNEFQPDVVHYMDALFWMQLATITMKPRRVLHVHGGTIPGEVFRVRDLVGWRFLRRRAHLFVYITEGARRSRRSNGIGWHPRSTVVYNGVDISWLGRRPSKRAARTELGLPLNAKILGMVCRLIPDKGCDDFIRLMALLGRDYHGLIVGDGPERIRLAKMAESLNVKSRVTLVGNMDDVRTAYAAMDGLLMLSIYEPFGLVVAEAMASSVPVFGLVGLGEYLESERPLLTRETGLLLWDRPRSRRNVNDLEDPETIQMLASHVERTLSEPPLFSDVVRAAFDHVNSWFSVDAQARSMAAVYRTLIAG